jgi:pimeloyl-ACP methyl ester carboxylesterase
MDVDTYLSHRRTLETPAGEIGYAEFGSGPAAVFVHGIGTNGLLWRHVIEEVSDTRRCVAIDLPLHGSTPPRKDLSVPAMAQVVADLCTGLGLEQVDLVANDTGGAVAQVFAARHPERLRTLVLTNCDSDGNYPPASFAPVIDLAARGELAPGIQALAADPAAARTSPLGAGYERPEAVPDEVWRAYLTPVGGTIERARDFERLLTALDPDDLKSIDGELRALRVPTLLVWGTADETFGLEWAYRLRDSIGGEVVEVDGAKIFFPEERPEDLVTPLRRHWGAPRRG